MKHATQIQVAIVEGYPILTMLIKELMYRAYPDCQLTMYKSTEDFKLRASENLDVIVLDLNGPPDQQIEDLKTVSRQSSRCKLICFTELSCPEITMQIELAGGLRIGRELQYADVLDKIGRFDQQSQSDVDMDPPANEFQSNIQFPEADKPLTKKQVEVMEHSLQGLSAKEIAREMNLSHDTVRAHMKQAYMRLMARNRAQAVSNYVEAKKLAGRMLPQSS